MRIAERPTGVFVLAVILALGGLGALLSAVVTARAGAPRGAPLIDLAVAATVFAIVWGLLKLRAWAWTAALVVEGLNALFATLAITVAPRAPGPWIALLVAALALFVLLSAQVRAAFGKMRARA